MNLRCRGKLFSWPYNAAKKSFSFFPLKQIYAVGPQEFKEAFAILARFPGQQEVHSLVIGVQLPVRDVGSSESA